MTTFETNSSLKIRKVGEILLSQGFVTAEQLQKGVVEHEKTSSFF